MNSIVFVGGGIAPSGHHTGCSHSRMVNFVWYPRMGFVVHGPSIGRCCQSFGRLKPLLQLFVLGLGRWEVLLLS